MDEKGITDQLKRAVDSILVEIASSEKIITAVQAGYNIGFQTGIEMQKEKAWQRGYDLGRVAAKCSCDDIDGARSLLPDEELEQGFSAGWKEGRRRGWSDDVEDHIETYGAKQAEKDPTRMRRKENDMAEIKQPLLKLMDEIIEKEYRLGYEKGYVAAERNCGAMDEDPKSCETEQPRERS